MRELKHMRLRRQARGLTLVELMVVLVILALLSAIVYPLYTSQTRKARRVEAKSTLMGIALAQERRLSRVGRYGTAAQLGAEYTELIDRMTDRDGAAGPDYYTIVVAAPTPTTFTVTATARGAQEKDTACKTFTVDQLGKRTAKNASDVVSNTCW